jgi:hypothetical protein
MYVMVLGKLHTECKLFFTVSIMSYINNNFMKQNSLGEKEFCIPSLFIGENLCCTVLMDSPSYYFFIYSGCCCEISVIL